MKQLEQKLGYTFKSKQLLEQALTHPSMNKNANVHDYERLEFLGDRVLGLVMADTVFFKFPNEDEGKLARRHSNLVKRDTLVDIAKDMTLQEYIHLSKSERVSGGAMKPPSTK